MAGIATASKGSIGSPAAKALRQSADDEAARAQGLHGLIGQHAEGSSAVCDDLAIRWQFSEHCLERTELYAHRSRQVPGHKLVVGSHVQHHHAVVAEADQQLVTADRLKGAIVLSTAELAR